MRRQELTRNANAGQQADNSYYNQTLSNPVVNPVDKYSYSQMVNDISALASVIRERDREIDRKIGGRT